MYSVAPLRKTYSTLSSRLTLSDDAHSDNEEEAYVGPMQRSKSNPRTIPRHSFPIRVIIFVLLEFGFIALISAALWRPIILPLSFTITEVNGALTAVAILWHTLAIYVVKDILLNIFGAEWREQYYMSPSTALRELDSVSRLTTGIFDQIEHFASERATNVFRLSFISGLLLMLLNGLGPSTISVDFVPYEFPDSIQVANLTMVPTGDPFGIETLASYRANIITQLEMVENSRNYGFNIRQSNLLIPWPSDSVSENTTIKYPSDVIKYNFNCTWEIPSKSRDNQAWIVNGREWIIYYPQLAGSLIDPLILPLEISTGPDELDNSSLVPFIFIGSVVPRSIGLDLGDIPSMLVPCNTTDNPSFSQSGSSLDCKPLLASVLVCDPRFEILPATINATTSSLDATMSSNDAVVKNIPTTAAKFVFSKSLLDATSSMQSYTDQGYANAISRQLFLSSLVFDGPTGAAVKPLSVEKINENMNRVLASSAKAYLSGYKPNEDNITVPSFSKINTTGVVQIQKMGLVGSKPFLIVSSVIIGLLVVLLSVIVSITRADQLEGFELENIVKTLWLNDRSSRSY